MHLQSLLEPQLDPPDVAPVLQRISFECLSRVRYRFSVTRRNRSG